MKKLFLITIFLVFLSYGWGNAQTVTINTLPELAEAPAAGDFVPLWDTSTGITKKVSITNLLSGVGGGAVATDTIWDAAGDMVQGTGANTAGRTAIGTAGKVWMVNAGATAGEWNLPIPLTAGSGTVDAITADYTPNVTLADGRIVAFRSAGANTSATPTFAPDGLTAHTIVKNGGAALLAGNIGAAGYIALLQYDLANTRWELLNPVPLGDVESVGDCTSGACLDGTSDGGTYIGLYDGTSSYLKMTGGVRTLTLAPQNASAEDLVLTFGNNDNTIGLSSTTGANLINFGSMNIAFGADPGDTGAIRLSNNTAISWEQSTPGTDVFIALDSSDILQVGQNAANIYLGTSGTGNVQVTGDLTVLGADINLLSTTAGLKLTGANRVLTIAGQAANSEDLVITLGNNDNTVTVSSTTGVTTLSFGSMAITAGSFSAAKSSGVAGLSSVYEANSTDTSYIGWMGPASISESFSYQFSNTQPTAGQAMVFAVPTGTGDPNGNKVSAQTWITPIQGSVGTTTNVVPKANGTGGATLQASGITEDGTNVDIGALNLATTGTITGKTKIVTVTGNCTFGTDCDSTSTKGLNGGFVLVTAAAVVTLSAGAVGQMACFYERDASEALSVKPASGEQIVLNGALLDANHKVTSASGAGDFICLAFLEAGKWYSLGRSGTWTDGAE